MPQGFSSLISSSNSAIAVHQLLFLEGRHYFCPNLEVLFSGFVLESTSLTDFKNDHCSPCINRVYLRYSQVQKYLDSSAVFVAVYQCI